MSNIEIANIIGYIAAFGGVVMFLPQVMSIAKTKQTKGISLASFSIFAIVSCLWFVYGLLMSAMPIIIVNFILGVLNVYIVVMKLKYK